MSGSTSVIAVAQHGAGAPSPRGRGPIAPIPPLDVDGVRTVAIGTLVWALAFVVLFVQRGRLEAEGLGWWLETCLAGVGLGLWGVQYCRRRREALRSAAQSQAVD